MDGQGIDGMTAKEIEQRRKFIRRIKADPGLDREPEMHDLADILQNLVNLPWIPQ